MRFIRAGVSGKTVIHLNRQSYRQARDIKRYFINSKAVTSRIKAAAPEITPAAKRAMAAFVSQAAFPVCIVGDVFFAISSGARYNR